MRMFYAPDGIPDSEPNNEQETTEDEIHTEHEIELEQRVIELTERVSRLIDENKKLYLKLSGTNTGDNEPNIEDELQNTIASWGQSGFNPEKLFN